ncbi:hypothetical protein FQN60_009514, partial [Etheostoma spectabile]
MRRRRRTPSRTRCFLPVRSLHLHVKQTDGSTTASSSSLDSLSQVDTHTPSELRGICLIEDTFRPSPPPLTVLLSRKRVSRLSVFTTKLSEAGFCGKTGVLQAPLCPLTSTSSGSHEEDPVVTTLAPTPPTVPSHQEKGNSNGVISAPCKNRQWS